MKRNIDLIREILLQVEALPTDKMWQTKPLIGYDIKDVVAHVRLAQDAGLLEAKFATGPHAIVTRMLNDGYDFLEQSKSPPLWERAKAKIVAAGLPMTIDIAKSVMGALINEKILHLK